MINATQCNAFGNVCKTLGVVEGISTQRAAILIAMSRSWTTLADQRDLYDAILKEEGRQAANSDSLVKFMVPFAP